MTSIAESLRFSRYQTHIGFSLIIPVYNEEKKILALLTKIREKMLIISPPSYEVIFVNDGSSDNTLSLLLEELKDDPNMSVISYETNRGKGYAVRQGMLSSRGDEVLFIDGDLQISPHTISECIEELKTHDLIIGSKSHPMSKIRSSFSRRFLSRLFNILVRSVFRTNLRDTQTGLKGGKGDILRDIFSIMTVDRYAFDVELLAIATSLKLSIKELPVVVNYSNSFRYLEVARMFLDMMILLYRYRIRNTCIIRMNQIKSKQSNQR